MSSASERAEISKADAAGEPCPTPLAWQQVITAVHEEREEFTFACGGGRLRGATFGRGRPLYFLGPIAGDWDLFGLTAWLLREDYRCTFVELPSLGYTTDAATYLAECADAVIAAADQLEDGRIALLGASFGATVALAVMGAHTDRVETAVLFSATAGRRLTLIERAMLVWGGLLPGRLRQLPGWKGIQEQNHRRWFPPFDHSRFEFLLQNLGETSIAGAARRQAVLGGVDLRSRLAQIDQRVLVVRTEGEGRILAEHQRELQGALPAAVVEEMHNTGQLPYLTHPHRVAKLVRGFLD
ncbi:MAG: alpha/beta hydrolase [Planctomycetota bacterium]|nr:MAG: alpha/beta hydrolase [Planctomycetota bacterium]REK24406.1 MAG: alpha/beta hydrolase [Planctomycetota bacterium]REK38594.1 MAG: alpha/beta hydrolase [Planctomycetota bacterium]